MKGLFKRVMLICSAAAIAAGCLTGCGNNADIDAGKVAFNKEGYPIVDEPIELNVVAAVNVMHNSNYNDMIMFKEYQEKSNVIINWTLIPRENLSEKKGILLAGGELPDVFYNMAISPKEATQYGSQGVFIELGDLIDKYAPNFKEVMNERPGVKPTITSPDGKIYTLATVGEAPEISTEKAWINKKWLDKLGLDVPTTSEELYEVLKAFKTGDPNGNGIADEIPMTGTLFNRVQSFTHGMFGLANSGSKIIYQYMDKGSDGKVRYFPMDEKYPEAVAYMKRLYSEGLLDKEIFTMDTAQFTAKGEQNLVGMFAEGSSPSIVGNKYSKDFVPLPVLEGPHGDRLWSNTTDLITFGTFAITSACKNPEIAMRWVDYWYSDEGNKLLRLGKEGETYRTLEDGTFDYTEFVTNNPNGLSRDQAIGQFSVSPGGTAPTYNRRKYMITASALQSSIDAVEMYKPYMPDEIWQFTYTPEEVSEMTTLNSDINGLTSEKTSRWVTGQESLDTYEDYKKQIKKMGVDRFIEIYQNGYDRWLKARK